jgi:peptidoglycan/xylan/chitin deacetylase (PgdA/CDA1 family)
MKAVMYHYVRPFDVNLPSLKSLHFDDFQKQIDYFLKTEGIVSKDDFINSLKTGEPLNGVVLTFDDGLKCHYKFVYKELKKRNLWGIFYVPTKVYTSNKILDVHRIHILLACVSSKSLYESLLLIVKEHMLSDSSKVAFEQLTYVKQINDKHTVLVKKILNYFISYEYREQVIDQLMEQYISNEIHNVENFYITKNEMLEMNNNGMTIGSHTLSHPVLSKLTNEEQYLEISESFQFLENICKTLKPKTFCYPYGGFHSFNDNTELILCNENVDFSFNVEHRDIENSDLINRPQALPRFDCNQFEFGQIRS